jgi:hypothetical protein
MNMRIVVVAVAVAAGCGSGESMSDSAREQSASIGVVAAAQCHDPCVTGAKMTSSCSPCVASVCSHDGFCCRSSWDQQCVSEVSTFCGPTTCSGGCTPQCSGKQCGPDGCGASCGTCPSGKSCNAGGQCSGGGGGGVGPKGGTVDSLYFAVVGDTRPANIDDTGNYPTPIITKIYQDLQAMNPPPQFIVTTGDYMFATPSGSEGPAQMSLYMQAESNYSGTVFHAMGNHECTGFTNSNCVVGNTSGNNNFDSFMSQMVKPLGYQVPYFSIPINATDGSWTAKLIVVACNAWDSTQKAWLANALAQKTTYTFVSRHEPLGYTSVPCVSDMDALLSQNPYNQFFVGHTHTYQHSGKQAIIGNGGAPTSVTMGYITVKQQGSSFTVTEYDYATAQAIDTWTFQ